VKRRKRFLAAERGGGNEKEVGALLTFGNKMVIDMRTPKKVFSIVENSARHSYISTICSNIVGKPSALPCGNFIYIKFGELGDIGRSLDTSLL
jgi:hypothetical protein